LAEAIQGIGKNESSLAALGLMMESGSRDEKQQAMAEIKSIAFQNQSVSSAAVKSGWWSTETVESGWRSSESSIE
jgi:hypothetical protein